MLSNRHEAYNRLSDHDKYDILHAFSTRKAVKLHNTKMLALNKESLHCIHTSIKINNSIRISKKTSTTAKEDSGPAAKSGLQIGDIVTEVDGTKVPNEEKTSSDDEEIDFNDCKIGTSCTITLNIEHDLEEPVYVYY